MDTDEFKCQHCSTKGDDDHYCNGHYSGILTKDEIVQFGILKRHQLLQDSLQATSYDLRLGEGHCIYRNDAWLPVWISENESVPSYGNIQFTSERHLTIEPFGCALIQLKETIDLRECADDQVLICGRFDLKLSLV